MEFAGIRQIGEANGHFPGGRMTMAGWSRYVNRAAIGEKAQCLSGFRQGDGLDEEKQSKAFTKGR